MTQNQGEIFFPKGCPKCKGKILFKQKSDVFRGDGIHCDDGFVYTCENFPQQCDVYVPAHKISKGGSIKDYPIGILTDSNLRTAHDLLRARFNLLWQGSTPRIKFIYMDFIVGYTDVFDEEEREVIGISGKLTNGLYEVYNEDKSDCVLVPADKIKKVSSRTKSYFWLAVQMGIPFEDCKIPMFDEAETERAIQIIDDALSGVSQVKVEINSKQ